jgi:hypothetical protein
MRSTACGAQEPSANPKPEAPAASSGIQPPAEQIIVSAAGLYGDWKMVLPEWPGFDKPVTGDFCTFKKHDAGLSTICADDFLQKIPEATFDGDKLRLRWGGSFNYTIYDAVWEGNGSFDGEISQASMGMVIRRIKAKMERISDPPIADAPQDTLVILTHYFQDLSAKSPRENYYEDDVYKRMKESEAKPAPQPGTPAIQYFGRILEDKGHGAIFPDVFKASYAGNAPQWCLVRLDARGLADVRCREIR